MECNKCGANTSDMSWRETAYVMAWAAGTDAAVGMWIDDVPCVRWLGVWWYGVPMPVRVAAWAAMVWRMERDAPEWEAMMMLPGCGCIVALKSKYERVRAWIRRHR